MTKEEKIIHINELKQKQIDIIKRWVKILLLPTPKRDSTYLKRMNKIIALSMHAKMLQNQIDIILSQPLNKNLFKIGGHVHGKEQIIIK